MRALPLVLASCFIAASAEAGSVERTFDLDRKAEGIARVVLEVGVGDVEVIAEEADRITAHVEVSTNKSWRGSARARRLLEELELKSDVRGDELHLSITRRDDDDHNFGEDWTLRLPPGVALEIQLGVGELRILDLAADIEAEVGVGDVRIEGVHAGFGDISASCGVGDVSLRTPEGREEGRGFIADSLDAQGPGKARLDVEVGVGDVDIRLR